MRKYCDVMVAGGGWGGTMAALAAASVGAKVLIVEGAPEPGGISVSAGMCGINAAAAPDGSCMLPPEGADLLSSCMDKGIASYSGIVPMTSDPRFSSSRHVVHTGLLGSFLRDYLLSHKVDLETCSSITSVKEQENCMVAEVTAADGCYTVAAPMMTDSTGNSEIWHMLDPSLTYRFPTAKRQSSTLVFNMDHVDIDVFQRECSPESLRPLIAAGLSQGKLFSKVLCMDILPGTREVSIIATHISGSCEDTEALLHARREGLSQVMSISAFIRENVPGFSDSRVARIADSIGKRDCRRIKALRSLTGGDLLLGTRFEHEAAFGCYPVDIHEADGSVTFQAIGGDGFFYVPYSSMINPIHPRLITGCRAIDCDHIAFGAVRVIPVVMGIGASAGRLAAHCAVSGTDLRDASIFHV